MTCKCIHHQKRGADQSKKAITYFQMLVACLLACRLAGWLADWLCIAWLVVHGANLMLTHANECLSINTGPFLKPRVSKSTRIHWRTRKCGQNCRQMHEIDHTNQSNNQDDLQNLAAGFASCLAAAFLGVSMTCKCIHHPERQVCRSIQEGNYIFPNVGGLLTCRLAG